MKKKFLSLMMAAAVVATTSVSAFASTTVVNSPDNQEAQSPVEITGNVQNNEGKDPVGTFKVTVPTTAKFTVTKEGTVISAHLDVKNTGSQEIEVYAHKFVDHSGNRKIDVISEDVLTPTSIKSKKNSEVALKLTSSIGDKVAYLSSNSSEGGIYENKELDHAANGLGVKLLTLSNGTEQEPASGQIILEGKGGKMAQAEAISDDFTLTLKIKKVDKQVGDSSQDRGDSASGEQHPQQ